MKKKKIAAIAAALLMGYTIIGAPCVSVSAEEDETEAEEEIIEFTYDADMLTAKREPAISFDGADYRKYIHAARDNTKANLTFEQDKDTSYQGVSLRVSADTKGVAGYFSCSGFVTDEDNNKLYPNAPEETDVINMSIIGVELRAEDFGLSTFDGCLFNFAYRMTAEDEEALMGSTVWVYSTNSDYVRKSNPLQLKVNSTIDDNVNQYRNNALISVPDKSNSTRLIIDIPTQNAVTGNVLFLDNIIIELPDSADVGDAKYIKNIDGYNENAKVSDIVDEIKISKGKNDTTIADKKIEKKEDNTKKHLAIFIGSAVAVIAVVGGIVFVRNKKRFY